MIEKVIDDRLDDLYYQAVREKEWNDRLIHFDKVIFKVDNEPIGFVIWREQLKGYGYGEEPDKTESDDYCEAYVILVYIKPEFRGQGYGKQMMNEWNQMIDENEKIESVVVSSEKERVGFYESLDLDLKITINDN